MKAGRLKIVNQSRYDDAEVDALVRFALQEINLKGSKLLVAVQNNRRREYRGWAERPWRTSEDVRPLAQKAKASFVNRILLGHGAQFPIREFKRHGITIDYATWQEALVGVAAHEGQHSQHDYDGAYTERTGVRNVKWWNGRRYVIAEQRYRLIDESVELKCRAFEAHMLRRYREAISSCPAGLSLVPSGEQTAMAREAAA